MAFDSNVCVVDAGALFLSSVLGFTMSLKVHCVPRASVFAADRRATAAWTISTETDAVGIKKGNYV